MFSVIIPVHNKLPHLDRSIYSVLNQTYSDFELLLIDDASTDGSSEKIAEYEDSRIRRFRRDTPGPGGYAARNLGIQEAKYEWIAFLDADDEWKNEYLDELAKVLVKDRDVELISSSHIRIKEGKVIPDKNKDKYGETISCFSLSDYLKNGRLIWTGSVSIKRALLLKSGMFPAGKCKRGGDLNVWINCLYRSNKNIFINKDLAIYYRDTVNRVTAIKTRPKMGFCAAEPLKKIKEETNDRELLKAINVFIVNQVYWILVNGHGVERKKTLLNLLPSRRTRLKVQMKIFLRKLLTKINIYPLPPSP